MTWTKAEGKKKVNLTEVTSETSISYSVRDSLTDSKGNSVFVVNDFKFVYINILWRRFTVQH